ncbi:hypothetical protein DASC09_045430 [Saccharomycopsis crataegensis]|uniref:Uncharacterized protein n=1 Tax=Saccharomycopsis crataegensis TaxID=43959 RepID=A0AAV5QQL8_9ASCO|nr:hypothetical protein DASC09_045430 [Saccharomycopsis crataegensis]
MSSLEEQSLKRKNRLQQLRNRKKQTTSSSSPIAEDQTSSIIAQAPELTGIPKDENDQDDVQQQLPTTENKPKKPIVSRNLDPETKLPVNAFTSQVLAMELDTGETVELISGNQENQILNDLSRRYRLDQDDEESDGEQQAVSTKIKVTSDFEKDLKDYKIKLELQTNKMIRTLLKERLQAEKN